MFQSFIFVISTLLITDSDLKSTTAESALKLSFGQLSLKFYELRAKQKNQNFCRWRMLTLRAITSTASKKPR